METEKQKLFVQRYLETGNANQAKSDAGYSDDVPVSQVFASKGVSKLLRDETNHYLEQNAPVAVYNLLRIMKEDGILGARDKLAAIKEVLDRAGFTKTDKVQVETKSPLFILPSKDES